MARRRRATAWSPEARTDLSNIWDYYAKLAGRRRADNVDHETAGLSRLIEVHPFAGRARDEVRPGLRSIPAHPLRYLLPRYLLPRYLLPRYLLPRYLLPRYLLPRYLLPRYLLPRPGRC